MHDLWQKMLLWKFYRMVWTAHANIDALAPSWVVQPAKITLLHPRLTQLTPVMVQALGKQKDLTINSDHSLTAYIELSTAYMPHASLVAYAFLKLFCWGVTDCSLSVHFWQDQSENWSPAGHGHTPLRFHFD